MDIIGMQELMLIALVALLVIGPERLPETLRTLGLWLGRLRRSFNSVKNEIEKEVGMDEIRRQLHNEAVMEEMKRIEREVNTSLDMNEANAIADSTPPDTASDEAADSEPAADATRDGAQASAENNSDQTTEPTESAQPDKVSEATAPQPMPSGPIPRSEAELEAFHEERKKQLAEREQAAKES